MRKAVFLDRDGTINREVDNLRDASELRLLHGAARAIARLNKLGYLVIVVTNQPVVARGWITEEELDEIHAVIIRRLGSKNAKIDAIYYCPHHPNANLKKYRMRCGCRKPGTGMIRKAARECKINLKKSFMVGDAIIDVVAGKRAGLKTILVKSGPGHLRLDKKYKTKPNFTVKNLSKAISVIKNMSGNENSAAML